MIGKRTTTLLAAGGMVAGMVAIAPTAQAGTTWGGPQEVSSKFGSALVVSDGGRVAAWVRTNKTSTSATGPVRTSWYRGKKKGWTPSAPIPGASESSRVQLSANGNLALIEADGAGYLLAARSTGNTWSAAQSIVTGTKLTDGAMSADASIVVWVEWPTSDEYPPPAGVLKSRIRNADGTWAPVTTVGSVEQYSRYGNPALALSRDGSTLMWADQAHALVAATRNADGSWSAPVLVKQYPDDPDLESLKLSADGSRAIWVRSGYDGILTATRSGAVWSPVSNVTVDETAAAALAPNGSFVAWANSDGQMLVSKWNGTKFPKPKVLGTVSTPSIALTNKTIAWTASYYRGSQLRSVIWKKGAWTSSVRHAMTAFSPAVSYDGNTVAWATTGVKKIYSSKR
ncbi:MAG TPA: hypothetical protein PLT68_09600 [Actinomycetota bacterium]|nr:hypothetical protein [Actinomycetota bacterium]